MTPVPHAREHIVLVPMTVEAARAVAECVTTSGKMTYTGPGVTLFNGAQQIERALDAKLADGGLLVHDLETENDLPVTRISGGHDGAPVVLHLD